MSQNIEEKKHLGASHSTPLWVKVFGIIALVLILLVGIMLLSGGGGEHGPGRHMPPTQHSMPQP
jgi:hypothetical protein